MTCLAEYGLKKGADRIIRDPFQEGFEHPYGREDLAQGNALVVYEPKNSRDLLTAPGNSDTLKATGGTDFYVAPGGEAIPAAYESWIGENQRDAVISNIDDHSLRSVVGQIYPQNSVIGEGSLIDQIYFSEATGLQVVRESDYRKIERLQKFLERQLDRGLLSENDKKMAETFYEMLLTLMGE